MQYRPAGASHLPVLTTALLLSDGPVLEMGMGPFSTPIMHWLCLNKNRPLFSYENNNNWYKKNKVFETKSHKVTFVINWDDVDIENTHWGVAFIDHAPNDRRIVDIKRLANIADYVVIHDSGDYQDEHYRYSEIYPLFSYRYGYEIQKPYTTVLSNFNNLDNLKKWI